MAEEEIHEEVAAPTEPEVNYQDLWLRSQAEVENIRKRSEQERANLLRFGQANLIEELLPIVDNFDRATKAVPADQEKSGWVTGIQYIQKNLMDVLQAQGVTVLSAKSGDTFDAQQQEALATVPTAEMPEGKIVDVIANGYMLHDRLLRPIRVTVSEAAKDQQTTNE